ncbi:DUF2500 domain-containing protein [Cytobacillus sp. FJAT-54145]|uniref:DUF2500 domain-containing protein n=1 Tax=Cytobacillus spartinae TaxID=3299023 RepID=A0ABW6KEL1_9BACI
MMGFDPFSMFSIFSMIFPVFFLVVFGIIAFSLFKGVKQWNFNNKQPVLTVSSKVVSKRTHVRRNAHNHNNHVHSTTSTKYYVTFEVESGDRMELHVSGNEFGHLAEGDYGKLTFQGTRYLGFDRWKDQ